MQLGLKDYFNEIVAPMSLPQIERRLNSGKYNTFEAFQEDVSLIVANAQKYNRIGDPVYGIASEFWHEFENLKKKHGR